MSILRLDQLPDGSGSLSNDDIFLFMDDPSGSGVTKKISLNDISNAIGGGGGNANTGDISFSGVSIIGSGTGSGDGNNKGTIELVPDNTLYNNDQYLIVDPTAPNHVHLRAGGNIDGSSAELIVGGEYAHVNITDYNHQVSVSTASISTQLFSLGNVESSISSNAGSTSDIPVGSKFVYNGTTYTITNSIYDEGNEYRGPNYAFTTDPVPIVPEGFPTENQGGVFTGDYEFTLPASQKNWTFQNDGVLQLSSSGIKFNDGSIQNTAASNLPVVFQLGSVSGTINTDASSGDIFDFTLTGSGLLANPSNPTDGQTIRWRISYANNSIPISLGINFKIPSSASSPLPFSSTSGTMDMLGATYDQSRNKWDVIAFVPGY